jgi:hypothetical protein
VCGVALHQGSINPSQLAGVAGIDGNHTLKGTVAKMTVQTLAVVVPDDAADVTYHVECGQCPDSVGAPRTALYAVMYERRGLDGDSAPDRLFSCKPCLADVIDWADAHNDGFVPTTITRLPEVAGPRCPWCHSPVQDCVTNFRGVCTESPVARAS